MSKKDLYRKSIRLNRAKLWPSLSIKSIVRRTKELRVLHIKEDFPGSRLFNSQPQQWIDYGWIFMVIKMAVMVFV